jgi:hypothetical protein
MRYPEVIHRQLWITCASGLCSRVAARLFRRRHPLATVQTAVPRTRTLKLEGTKIASMFLQAQLLLFSQNHFSNALSRHRVKVFSEVIGAVRGCVMKRRTARQLVRLLSDIRHASHCTTLRAAATNRAIFLASSEHDEEGAENDESNDTPREASHDKPARSES